MAKTKPAKDFRPTEAISAKEPWLAAAFAVLAAAYLAWFVVGSRPIEIQPPNAPPGQLESEPLRVQLLRQLGDPFSFVAQWFGPAGTPLGLLDRVPVLAMAGVILLASYGVGRLVVGVDSRTMRREQDQLYELERTIFALAAGLSVLSTIVLLGGLAGLLQVPLLWWLLAGSAAIVGAWWIYRDHWSRLCSLHSAFRIPRSPLVWVAIVFSTMIVLGGCLPPWNFDVREYHLQVPKEWFQQGRITFLPHNVYGNMPLGAEMHALAAMALWPGEDGWFHGALAGTVVIAAYAIIAALGLVAAGERMAGRWAGWLAACLFLGHPWVVHVSVSGLNDGALAANVFLAAYALWLARRGACGYLLPGLLAGAAAACKYPGLVFAVAPLAVWCCLPRSSTKIPTSGRGKPPTALPPPPDEDKRNVGTRGTLTNGQGFGFALAPLLLLIGVLAGGGAWYAKNAIPSGNPVYPLAYDIFGGKTRTPENSAQWQRAHRVPPDQHGRKYSLPQLANSVARIAGQDDLASPLLVLLMTVYFLTLLTPHSAFRIPHSATPFALLLLLILATWWLVSHRLDRFLLPAWPLAALLASVAAASHDGVWWRRAVAGFAVLGLAYCLLAAASPLVGDNRWFVALTQLRRDEPWPADTPLRVKPEHKFLNANVEPGQAVLLVGEAAPFDLAMPVYYNTCFDDCLLCDWMLGKTAAERSQQLDSRNIAWVLVDWPEIRRYQLPGNYGFDPRFRPELLDELVAQGVLHSPTQLVPGGTVRPAELYPVPDRGGSGPKPGPAGGVP